MLIALRNTAPLKETTEPQNSVKNVDNIMDVTESQLNIGETKALRKEQKNIPKILIEARKILSKTLSKEQKILPRILLKEPKTLPKILPKEPKILPKILPKEQKILFQILPQEFMVIDEKITNSTENCNSQSLDTGENFFRLFLKNYLKFINFFICIPIFLYKNFFF